MTRLKQTSTIAAALLLTATLGACTSAGGNGVATSSPSASSSSSASTPATTTATPTQSPEELAIAAAKEKIPAYFAVSDKSLQDTKAFNREEFKTVAITTALDDLGNLYSAFQAQDYKQVGATTVESMSDPKVNLTMDLKKTPPDVPNVQLQVCIDVSKLNVVDSAGKSVVPANRKPRQLWRIGVANYEYPKAAGWRVAYTDTQGGKTC